MKLEEKLRPQTFVRGIQVLMTKGPKVFLKKAANRLRPQQGYDKWFVEQSPSEDELKMQRNNQLNGALFSIIVPLYRTKEIFLRELIESVIAQSYIKWELCFADGGAAEDHGAVGNIVKEYSIKHPNIRYLALESNMGISGNTNEALGMARGDFIALLDHDDLLAPNALYEMACVIKNQGADIIYSDEDKIDMEAKNHFMPHFKPDFNLDLLRSQNYICHLFAVRSQIARMTGGFRKEYDGSQDHDFILRCVEQSKRIVHIPKILYHWRVHPDSTAEKQENKLYAFEAGRKAVADHYKRLGIHAEVRHSVAWGVYRTVYELTDTPLISIVIPNKDHIEDLSTCIVSIEACTYKNIEIIIVENNSTQADTSSYYEQLTREKPYIKVVKYSGRFNYSKLNNLGVSKAQGEYILLLNNDTKMIHSDCLNELLGTCMREDVGVVGARLYYPDDTLQHAGAIVGMCGIAKHVFLGQEKDDLGYFARAMCQQDYSAVTAACMMTKRSVYCAVRGFSKDLAVAFNDIDYCLKVRRLGKLVVYNPYAELYHDESKSRGAEDSLKKRIRFHKEILLFANIWKSILEQGDPYYNRNCTLDRTDYSLKYGREQMRPKGEYFETVQKQLQREMEQAKKCSIRKRQT